VYRASTGGGSRRSARTRSWPSSYLDPPLLIVADNEVCNAAICTAPSTASSTAVNNGGVATSADDIVFFDPSADPAAASADQLQVTVSPGIPGHPPPLRTQRSDPGPTDRTTFYDRTVVTDTDEAPP